MLLELLDQTPVTADMVRSWTRRDPILSKVTHFLHTGWPETTTAEIKPYKVRVLELTVQEGCLLWGNRIIIPPQGRKLLQELHDSHPGIARMKGLARGGQALTMILQRKLGIV